MIRVFKVGLELGRDSCHQKVEKNLGFMDFKEYERRDMVQL
jgi:hypothetical protein